MRHVRRRPVSGATFLLNSPYPAGPSVGARLPSRQCRQQIIDKRLRFYVVDAYDVARAKWHGRAHQHGDAALLLQALAGVLPRERTPIGRPSRSSIEKTYGKRGESVVRAKNSPPSTGTRGGFTKSKVPAAATSTAASPAVRGPDDGARFRQAT